MALHADSDTIVACATPPGRGGVAIVRLSGPRACALAESVAGRLPPARQAVLRALRDLDGGLIDRGLVLWFQAPHSFTGEDVVEFQVHGSPVVVEMLLRALAHRGARAADPGEFSQRAFLNGRMDLAQAEAVADLVASASAEGARAAIRSLEGELSAGVTALIDGLAACRARLEAGLDFPEEGVDEFSDPGLDAELGRLLAAIDGLRESAARGRVLRDGMTLVIAGAPNVGKSSLLNRLAGYEAAIVTELPGTTRDLVREDILIDGMPVRVVDTAGLRASDDRVEAEGMRRAHAAMQAADLVLLVREAGDDTASGSAETPLPGRGQGEPGEAATDPGTAALPEGIPVLHIRNKIDLAGQPAGEAEDVAGIHVIHLSALTGDGLELLREHLKRVAGYTGEAGGACSARGRHLVALDRGRHHLDTARTALLEGATAELAAEDLRLAQQALGEITGEVTTEDLLGRIFSEFCIGK
ncbi:tRNA uridine-5-carboxymethylaminomethyl(34) synthesis GTPase MnmE [Wenzhouxiangella sp. XN24]|uniref:tRNA uridine-5-carboxymethylaminomethyl(34) synthesis GTPase MnmE n=1 Tax=Wenzhouxiangella sp. XN24 TaxID=2713569 RepID=UPI0013E9F3E0|nr:tRNA uridine-5-carboxymethylaminomethyl(34) synthesis GTPase MnmE [Wenzhouxiangella sp. XN24]NGX17526.1 tRNA uridine-5-carboxymethylaminomethyl(34) synthesis GTPase MnmE [Wenzhouxiangella sp. XN24]